MATLITGLGYIGSALARRLIDQGEYVIGIENFFSTDRALLDPLLATGSLRLVEGSITDEATLREAFSIDPVMSVFHLAGQASARLDAAPLAYTQETNFTGPRMLLDACRAFGVERVVLASSMRLYRTPLPDVVTEDAPVDPSDLVHLSQLYGEVLLEEHGRRATLDGDGRKGFDGVAARLGIVHGVSPVMKTDPRFLAAPQLFCLEGVRGEPLTVMSGASLAFVHIDDAVSGMIACREHAAELRVVNVASEVRSIASVAEAVQQAGVERGLSVDVRLADVSPLPNPPPPGGRGLVESSLTAYGFKLTLRIEDSVGAVLDYYLTEGRSCASL